MVKSFPEQVLDALGKRICTSLAPDVTAPLDQNGLRQGQIGDAVGTAWAVGSIATDLVRDDCRHPRLAPA